MSSHRKLTCKIQPIMNKSTKDYMWVGTWKAAAEEHYVNVANVLAVTLILEPRKISPGRHQQWYGFCNKKSKEFIRRVYCKIPSTWLLLKKKTIIAAFLPVTMSTQKKTICVSPIIFFGKISIYSELCDIVLSSLWFSTSDFDKHVFFCNCFP